MHARCLTRRPLIGGSANKKLIEREYEYEANKVCKVRPAEQVKRVTQRVRRAAQGGGELLQGVRRAKH